MPTLTGDFPQLTSIKQQAPDKSLLAKFINVVNQAISKINASIDQYNNALPN